MTREKAIELAIKACEETWNEKTCKQIKEALEQKPCDEAISKQAVLEIFGHVMDYWKEHAIDVEPHEIKDALIEQYEFTAKQLSELPPVTPQQKTGYWIPLGNYDDCGNESSYKCSECGDLDTYSDNYCPNCGAKMA